MFAIYWHTTGQYIRSNTVYFRCTADFAHTSQLLLRKSPPDVAESLTNATPISGCLVSI